MGSASISALNATVPWSAGAVSCQQANDACLPHAGAYPDSQPFEFVGAHLGSAKLLVPDLGVGVQVLTNFADAS